MTVEDSIITVGDQASISVSAVFDHDGLPYSGIFTLNDSTLAYDTPGRRAYTVSKVTPLDSAVSVISMNDVVYVIWDQLEVYWHESEYTRTDIDSNVEVRFRVRTDYSESIFTDADGIIYINGTAALYRPDFEYWYVSVTESFVTSQTYVISDSLDSHRGLTKIAGAEMHVCRVTWDIVYVSRAGVRGRSPFFNPEVEYHASRVVRSELDWTLTVFFCFKYMSDDTLVSEPSTTVVVNGQSAVYVAERERWEVNVTSPGIGAVTYQIEEFRDVFGLTEVNHMDLYPTIEWFPSQLLTNMITIGAIGSVLGAAVLLALRARRRVAILESALDPDRILSIEEIEVPAQTTREIVDSLDTLAEMYDQIPLLDDENLRSFQYEMSKTLALLNQAFASDVLVIATEDPLSPLKKALIIRVRLVLKSVTKEIALRSR